MRIEGAMQFMTYEKMLRLRNGGDKVLSQAITFCTNDQERIFECVAGGVLAFGINTAIDVLVSIEMGLLNFLYLNLFLF